MLKQLGTMNSFVLTQCFQTYKKQGIFDIREYSYFKIIATPIIHIHETSKEFQLHLCRGYCRREISNSLNMWLVPEWMFWVNSNEGQNLLWMQSQGRIVHERLCSTMRMWCKQSEDAGDR